MASHLTSSVFSFFDDTVTDPQEILQRKRNIEIRIYVGHTFRDFLDRKIDEVDDMIISSYRTAVNGHCYRQLGYLLASAYMVDLYICQLEKDALKYQARLLHLTREEESGESSDEEEHHESVPNLMYDFHAEDDGLDVLWRPSE